MLDLVIANGKVVEANGVFEHDLWIQSGKVVGHVKRGEVTDSKQVVDAAGRFVIPGAIDTHSHIGQLPGQGQRLLQTREENFLSESTAAIFGGVTTALNYIFTQNSLSTALPEFQHLAQEYSRIDVKYHGSLMNELHLNEIEDYIKQGVKSFKIFLPYKGEEATKLGGLSSLNDGQLIDAFLKLKKFGGLPIIHAENQEMIDYFSTKCKDESRQDMIAWEKTRPSIVEGEAVAKVIYLAKKIGCRICIAHVSSAEAVDAIEEAGNDVILETCPHYLALTADAGLGALGKVSPPIRYQRDQDKLWEAIEKGNLVIIGSDHNSWCREHKKDLWQGLAGLPGNSYILPILFTEGVSNRGLAVTDLVRITSYQAAKIFGLYPKKGTLQVGSDADLVIMDTDIQKKVSPGEIPSIVDYSPYCDFTFTAWPHAVVRKGRVVVLSGKIID